MSTFYHIRYLRKSPADYHDYAHWYSYRHQTLHFAVTSGLIFGSCRFRLIIGICPRVIWWKDLRMGVWVGVRVRWFVVRGLLDLFGTFGWVEKVGWNWLGLILQFCLCFEFWDPWYCVRSSGALTIHFWCRDGLTDGLINWYSQYMRATLLFYFDTIQTWNY